MTIDLVQLGYYAAFALLGWWLSRRGLPTAPVSPSPAAAPLLLDQQTLVALLKALMDRMAQPVAGAGFGGSNVFHVPIEVSANPKAPIPGNSS